MEMEYKEIEDLEEIACNATSDIADGNFEFNKCLAYEFNVK